MWSTKVKKWGGFGGWGGPSEIEMARGSVWLLSFLIKGDRKVRFDLA